MSRIVPEKVKKYHELNDTINDFREKVDMLTFRIGGESGDKNPFSWLIFAVLCLMINAGYLCLIKYLLINDYRDSIEFILKAISLFGLVNGSIALIFKKSIFTSYPLRKKWLGEVEFVVLSYSIAPMASILLVPVSITIILVYVKRFLFNEISFRKDKNRSQYLIEIEKKKNQVNILEKEKIELLKNMVDCNDCLEYLEETKEAKDKTMIDFVTKNLEKKYDRKNIIRYHINRKSQQPRLERRGL